VAHSSTVLSQFLKLVPRHDFNRLAEKHHGTAPELRKTSRWDQFVAMALGQLGGRQSLRDIECNLRAQTSALYHLGTTGIARSSLARLNEQQSAELYEGLFAQLYANCQNRAPDHPFRFKNKLYLLDSSLIDLSLSLFPWAHYCKSKGALKLHVGLDHAGLLPAFAVISESKCHDAHAARAFQLPKGSIAVFDRGYTDYDWFNLLNEQEVFFVTRARRDMAHRVIERRTADRARGVTSDQTIALTSQRARETGLTTLRRVGYYDPETHRHYVFLTNHFALSAATIAAVCKSRWQVELFFKWIKQNRNAILTQIWIAMCVYLLLAYLKFSSQIGASLQQMMRLMQLNLFLPRSLIDLFKPLPTDLPDPPLQPQLAFA